MRHARQLYVDALGVSTAVGTLVASLSGWAGSLIIIVLLFALCAVADLAVLNAELGRLP